MKISTRTLLMNVAGSGFQMIALSVALFLLYRFLTFSLGLEMVGVWSLVVAATSLAQIADLGLSACVVKYVAKYNAKKDSDSIARVITTSITITTVFISVVLSVIYIFADPMLAIVVGSKYAHVAKELLPPIFLSFVLLIVVGIISSGLDGLQLTYVRSILIVIFTYVNLALCYYLVPQYGVHGVAYARVAVNMLSLLFMLYSLKYKLKTLSWFPFGWDRRIFNEIFSYSLKFQLISISSLLSDPITKSFLRYYGGLEMVAYYEMANRVVLQFRSLLVSVNQVSVPIISQKMEQDGNSVGTTYDNHYQINAVMALAIFSYIFTLAPFISGAFMGRQVHDFILIFRIITVVLLINSLTLPAYFTFVGIGILRWNIIGNIVAAGSNIIMCVLIGKTYQGLGALYSWAISVVIGATILAAGFAGYGKLSVASFLPNTIAINTFCALSICVLSLMVPYLQENVLFNLLVLLSFATLTTVSLYTNKLVRCIFIDRFLGNASTKSVS